MLSSVADLASTYHYQGPWTEAERLEVQVMETLKQYWDQRIPPH